jgi:predicted permease
MDIATDFRLAWRRLRKNPLFSAGVIGTLALGLAAATSIYTVVDGVLLKPLPFRDADRLVRVSADFRTRDLRDVGMSRPELDDYAQRSGAFDAIAGVWAISANVTGSDRPERVEVLLTSANYFTLLDAAPARGRTYTQADEQPGIAAPIVISDGFWRRGFGADPQVLGRTLRIDEDPYEIVGVMPAAFRHPAPTVETDVDVWAASGWTQSPFPPPSYSAKFIRFAIARLAPGVSLETARARLENLGRQLTAEHPDDYPATLGWTPRVSSLAAELVAGVRPVLWTLMGAIAFLLVIAVTNISNLLLARAVAREREVAVQRALGADGWRIARTLLVEGAVLTGIGAAAGFFVCPWLVELLLRVAPDRLPRTADVQVDYRTLLFAAGLAAATALLVALAPALQAAHGEVAGRLQEMGRGTAGGRRSRAIRGALVIAQVATAIVLMAGAGLLVRSLRNLQQIDTGVSTERVTTARVWLPQPNDPPSGPYFTQAARAVLIRKIVDRLEASPGVAHAGMSTSLPLTDDRLRPAVFAADGWPPDRSDSARAVFVPVTPGFFRALDVTLMRGRLIEDADDERTERVGVINETLAKTFFAGEDPVGRQIRLVGRRGQVAAGPPPIRIAGIVRDVHEEGIDAAPAPVVYVSLWQTSGLALTIVARGSAAAPSADVIRAAVQASDPNVPLFGVRTAEDLIARGLAQRRFAGTLIAVFAVMALLLAALGLHSVIAYSVKQRTHEIGVRLALGATPSRVRALVLADGMRLTAAGVVVGLAGALALSRLLTAMLFSVSSRDPVTLSAVVVLLVAVAGSATFAAAARAARIDPAAALRPE